MPCAVSVGHVVRGERTAYMSLPEFMSRRAARAHENIVGDGQRLLGDVWYAAIEPGKLFDIVIAENGCAHIARILNSRVSVTRGDPRIQQHVVQTVTHKMVPRMGCGALRYRMPTHRGTDSTAHILFGPRKSWTSRPATSTVLRGCALVVRASYCAPRRGWSSAALSTATGILCALGHQS